MCGLTGFLQGSAAAPADSLRATVNRMADTLRHRGPDDGDASVDAAAGIALAHRRLSIIDLSPSGRQPMVSGDGRFVLVYNGEVYNFVELRAELEAGGARFRGHSDTEVILEGCAAWGVRDTVSRLIGMFAFALWDRRERRMVLVRDRLGIKPLYWGAFGDLFLFGSELKSLRAHPGWQPEIDRDAVSAYMRHNYIPAPHTIYRGVQKLAPGCLLELSPGGEPVIEKYWDLAAVVAAGHADQLDIGDGEATDQLDALLRDAVRRRMVADVPLGAFLSGGIDSSTVVALMQAESDRPVKSFTIGFREDGYNEAVHAAAVARHLGTDHTELYVEPQHARDIIPRLADWYDEPFADSSQIPTFLISELTRKHVTVALSGDGGDELFAGYNRHLWAANIWRRLNRVPGGLRGLAASSIRAMSPGAWDSLFRLMPAPLRPARAGDKAHKLAGILAFNGPDGIYRSLVSHWTEPDTLVRGAREPKGLLWDAAVHDSVPDFRERMRFLDTSTYLPDDILTKVDRASMAVSLEARVPVLDHRVVEFAWRLPPRMAIRGRQQKWLLRQVLYRYVPKSLVERPKMGFGVPIDSWLRGPLRDWAEDLLSQDSLKKDGLLNPAPIRAKWAEHLAGTGNWQYPLWDVLMLQAWRRRWLPG